MNFVELCGKSTQRSVTYPMSYLLHERVKALLTVDMWTQVFIGTWGRVATVPKLHSVHINWNEEVLREFR